MIDILPDYPDNVLAVSGSGRITADDYRKVLVPEAEQRIARNGSIAVLYYLGPKYKGFSTSAAWSDLLFGLSRWSAFGRIAIVTDVVWIREFGEPVRAVLSRFPARFRRERPQAGERLDPQRLNGTRPSRASRERGDGVQGQRPRAPEFCKNGR